MKFFSMFKRGGDSGQIPQKRTKYTGMSEKSSITNIIRKPVAQENNGHDTKKTGGLLQGVGLYFSIVKGDIKHVMRMDEETKSKEETYNDFMEAHFGKVKK